MKKLFIELSQFTDRLRTFLTDEDYGMFQKLLMSNPDGGKVMPGSGGLRKIRYADLKRQKGKRGGLRVVYLHLPDVNRIYLIDIYDKDSKANLSAAELKLLKKLAENLKNEVRGLVK